MRRFGLAIAIACAPLGALTACSLLVSTDGLAGDATDAGAKPDTTGTDARSDANPPPPPPPPPPVDGGDAGASAYRAAVLADTPLGYWRFDEASGTTAKDEVGAHDGTYSGTLSLGAPGAILGESSTALTLTDGQVSMGDAFGFVGRAPFSVEAWIKPSVVDTAYRNIYSKLTTYPRTGHFMWIRMTEGVALERNVDYGTDGGLQQAVGEQGGAPLDAWTHIVVTYDGTTLRIYVNGTDSGSDTSTLSLTATSAPFLVGAAPDVGGPFVGAIDEVAVYGAALPPARVAAHYHASGR